MNSSRRVPLRDMLMLLAGLLFVAPVVLILINSFKTLPEINANPLSLPTHPSLQAYQQILGGEHELLRPMFHSFLLAAAVVLCLIIIAPMAAYGLVRRPMRGAGFLRGFFVAGLIVPFQVVMVPLLLEFRALGIAYTYFSLVLVHVTFGLPLAIFIYMGFLRSLPRELEEAAAIDGCGPLRTFWLIVYPLLEPCTVTIIIFWGLWIWNDFLTAMVLMGEDRAQLAFLQLNKLFNSMYVKNWDTIFAGAVVLTLPVTILFLTMQRRLIKGLTAGAVK